MDVNIQLFDKKRKNDLFLQSKYFNFHPLLLSSSWVVLLSSSLWYIQESPLGAMNIEDSLLSHSPIVKLDSEKSSVNSTKFYEDSQHPLTQEFWKKRDLSERLKNLRPDINRIKEEIINYKTNLIEITEEDSERYKNILKCPKCNMELAKSSQDIPHNELLIESDTSREITNGRSGNKVILVSRDSKNFIAIKKFESESIKPGLQELLYSLVALSINPLPQELKMARVCDAVVCPENSLSIIMEGANTHDIHHFLSTKLSKNMAKLATAHEIFHLGDSAENVVKACAEYLATFHIKNHYKLSKNINSRKYITHASEPFLTLVHNPLKEGEEENEKKTKIELLPLSVRKPRAELEEVTSSNIARLLTETEQEYFVHLAQISCHQFEENSGEIYRALQPWNTKEEKSYFLTITHGDAHGNNFFYNDSDDLVDLNGSKIRKDSFRRISMIDYASIIKTYGDIGDPAEDIGRFLGSLWDWAIKQDDSESGRYEKIFALQNQFFQSYLQKIIESKIFSEKNQKSFKKMFKENCSFYKLRFYRALFNAKKDQDSVKDKEIKLNILKSWIKENSNLTDSLQKSTQQDRVREGFKDRPWQPVEGGVTHCCLPDRSVGFIESAPERLDKSYLSLLWEELHHTGSVTLSSKAAIAGMGGVGKTSLALEYAHEALVKKAYNVIHWLSSGTEFSLLKGYRDLLLDMSIPIKDANDERIIELVNKHVPARGKCLFIYDNVPNPTRFLEFLRGKVPQNVDIIITTRCCEGWDKIPLYLDVFHPEDSIKYLLDITGLERTKDNEDNARDLAQELAHLPLALSHAANYIKLVGGSNVSGKTFEKYLEDFRQEPAIHFEEYRNPFKEAESEITYKNLIRKTLRMSRTLLSELAEKLMVYSSYLDPDFIPEEIFLEYCENKEELDKTLAELSSLSFIKKMQGNSLFSIHGLVQLVIRNEKEVKENQEYQKVFLPIVSIFNKLFEDNIREDKQVDKLLNNSPHILTLLEHSKRLKISTEEVHRLEWVGKILYLIGVDDMMRSTYYAFLNNKNLFNDSEKLDKALKKAVSFFKDSTRNDLADLPNWLVEIAEKSQPKLQKALGALYSLDQMIPVNYEQAYFWCKKAARQGDAEAQTILGYMYGNGRGVTQSNEEAVKWWTKAARQGHEEAQGVLGYAYETGQGVKKQDHKQAAEWYTMAAKQGHPKAQAYLGHLYETGQGVERDPKKAIELYTIAAEKGDRDAQSQLRFMSKDGQSMVHYDEESFKQYVNGAKQGDGKAQAVLGHMYETGQGVVQSDEEAIKWYVKAAAQGHPKAQVNLDLRAEMTQYLRQKNVNAIMEAAKQGDGKAQVILGYMYEIGRGVTRSNEEALQWYLEAAEKGNAMAQINVGWRYETGEGVKQNDKAAFEWYDKAAQQGNRSAKLTLAYAYKDGCGVQQNKKEAVVWLIKSAEEGYAAAQFALAVAYETGEDVVRDDPQAIVWYTKAADQGHAEAQCKLGMCYLKGSGIPKDEGKALHYLQKAVNQGHAHARYILAGWYEKGKDEKKALEYVQEAADQGDAEALFTLGRWYEDGKRVPKDMKKALECVQGAADQGFPPAQSYFHRMKRHAVKQNDAKSTTSFANMFAKVVEQGQAKIQSILEQMHFSREEIPQEQFHPKHMMKAEKSVTDLVQNPSKNNKRNNLSAVQENSNASATIQHAEKGNKDEKDFHNESVEKVD